MSNNLDLWNLVYTTDPSAVKPITGKSYKGSSPKPYWLIEQATKHLGACGIGWGINVIDQGFQQCGPSDVLHWATVEFWYKWNGERGSVQQMGGTKAAYMTNTGKLMVDEDAAKKSVTDGMVKAMSMVGFAGDIFSGRWDDSKYQAEASQYHQAEKSAAVVDKFEDAKKRIADSKTPQQLMVIYKEFAQTQYKDEITALCAERKKELENA